MSRTFLILHRRRDFVFLRIEIRLQFLQFTDKYYVSRTPFHFRRRAEDVLRRAGRLSNAFSTARSSTPKKWFFTSI